MTFTYVYLFLLSSNVHYKYYVSTMLFILVNLNYLAPVDTYNHQFNDTKKKKMRKFCHIYSSILGVTFFTTFLLKNNTIYLIILLCLLAVDISVLLGVVNNIIHKRERSS